MRPMDEDQLSVSLAKAGQALELARQIEAGLAALGSRELPWRWE